jgi:hypothetical protein
MYNYVIILLILVVLLYKGKTVLQENFEISNIETEIIYSGELSSKTEKIFKGVPKLIGPAFTYSLWLKVNNMDYKRGQWKNIFNRGSKDTSERNPGMWILPNENKLHIKSNTSNRTNDGIDATKFTFDLDTWYYLSVVFNDKNMKFYVDGTFSEEYNFSGTPKNTGDFYLNLSGGFDGTLANFDGKLANVEYINKAMTSSEIMDRMKATDPEKASGDIRMETIYSGELSGKTEKFFKGVPKVSGSAFTYSLWFNVDDIDYKRGKWKNIFNHGNRDTNEKRNPGMWIRENENKLHIRTETSNSKNDGIDATKFTFDLDTWYYLSVVIQNKNMKFYVDGTLSEEYFFSGKPKNTGDFFLNLDGGFGGTLATVEYINKAMTPSEIMDRMKATNPDKVSGNVLMETIYSGELNGKTEKFFKGVPKVSGSAFTYSLWFNVNSMDYKNNQWKNLFNHGTKDTNTRNPGMWIVPKQQRFHIRFDTSTTKNDGIEATKFAFDLDTWYYLSVVIQNKNMKFYVDGKFSEEYNFSGKPKNKGDFYLNLNGGFDGKLANVEYINKAMVPSEIIERMEATRPQTICKDVRKVTTLPNNLVKGLEVWRTIGVSNSKQNQECPPQQFGGITLTTDSGGKIETALDILEKQYYNVSIWAKTIGEMKIRPYTNNWNGDWKTLKSTDGWKNIQWLILSTEKANTFGFETSNKGTLFMPFLGIKTVKVPESNVKVKEYRSNGTQIACSIKDVGLNAIQGWCALNDIRNEFYIEANFDNLYKINRIDTRGRGDTPQWTTEYRIEYFDPYSKVWKSYGDKLEGNRDMNTVKSNPVNILTERVRIYPISFHMWPSMRVGFSGVTEVKDICREYKLKIDTEVNVIEKKHYTDLYNKECKKVSYYQYEQLEDKLKKSEIEAKNYEAKCTNSDKSKKEIIDPNNRTMSSNIKLDEKCEPIMPKPKKLKSKKPAKKPKKSKTDKNCKVGSPERSENQLLQEVVDEIQKLNDNLHNKEGKLEKINSEISLLQACGVPSDEKNKQTKLECKKNTTQNEIGTLKKQLVTCQANFNMNSVQKSKPTDIKEGFESSGNVVSCNLEQLNPYDIRKHKQYQQLISDIKKKAMAEAIHQCTPFNNKDIREHKDYNKVLQYVYQIASEQFADIKKHKDYNKLVSEVRRRTVQEYGRKTAQGYVKCPNECQMMAEIDIRKHPKFKEMIAEIVKKTAQSYGEPIPGTNPVMYRKCSSKKEDSTSNKCVSHFNVKNRSIEGFSSEKCPIAPQRKTDPFDITRHKQFPQLVDKIRQKTPNVEKVKDLLEAYNKCESEKRNCSKLVQQLRERPIRHGDITAHPQFDKYILKDVARGEIKRLKCELSKLKNTQTKCIRKFNIESFEGNVVVENPSEAQEIVSKINRLLMDMNLKSGIDDKKAFVDIKDATRKAMNSIEKLSKAAASYVEEVYNDIMAVEKGEKKMSDIAKKHRDRDIDYPVASEIKQMVECEADLHKNKKAIDMDKNELEQCKNEMVHKSNELIELTADTECKNSEKARDIRKDIEYKTDVAEKNMGTLEQKYKAIRSRLLEYENKNKYLKEELARLRVRCNENIQKLWSDNQNMKTSIAKREECIKGREGSVEKKRVELEKREQQLGEMKSREMEKYQYFRDRLSEERSVSNRYRAELQKLKSSMERNLEYDNTVRHDIDAKIAIVREECNNRVERYRKMYGEAEKLLDELRTKSMQTPELVEKINRVEDRMSKNVQTAMKRTKANILALTCPREGKQTQEVIDKGFMDDMNKMGGKVDKIEKEVVSKIKPEDMMWYNNKFALLK